MDKVTRKSVTMSLKDFRKEHEKLSKLSAKRPELVKKEAREQGKELRSVNKKVKRMRHGK